MVKFLIIGDLHGSIPQLYFKPEEYDAIIAPGDFCSDETRKYMFLAIKLMREEGIDIEWYDLVGREEALHLIEKSLEDGRKVLELLNNLGKPVFILPGNWDWTGGEDEDWKYLKKSLYHTYLIKGLKNIYDLHLKKKKYQGITLIGHGITSGPELPQGKEQKRITKEKMKEKKKNYNHKMNLLKKLFNKEKNVIFLTHNVPYQTKLDLITNKESPRYGQHYGSIIARDIIKKYHPLTCIGGHMHEHFGSQTMNKRKTVAINAGFGGKVNCLLDIDEKKGIIKSITFINKDKRKDINRKVL